MAKQYPPSAKKLRKARQSGDVLRCRFLVSTLQILSVLVTAYFFRSRFVALGARFDAAASLERDLGPESVIAFAGTVLLEVVYLMAPLLAVAVCSSVASQCVLMGGMVCVSPRAKFDALNPVVGCQRLLSLWPRDDGSRGVVWEVVWRAFLSLTLLALTSGFAFLSLYPQEVVFDLSDARDQLFALSVFSVAFCTRVTVLLLALCVLGSLVALFIAIHERRKRLGMDREELKRELRESEGDPHVAWARRALYKEILQSSVVAGVRRATVLVVGQEVPRELHVPRHDSRGAS